MVKNFIRFRVHGIFEILMKQVLTMKILNNTNEGLFSSYKSWFLHYKLLLKFVLRTHEHTIKSRAIYLLPLARLALADARSGRKYFLPSKEKILLKMKFLELG